ncbi:MAG: hypothetical protein ACOYJK_00380 [Prevotella sp.]|jgi:uncharacterized membrane protein YfbV (UPF0208 family)
MEKEFENYWKHHQSALIQRAPQALKEERTNTGKMNTAGDWILFAVPIVAMVAFMNYGFFAKEMVNFLVSLIIGVVCFILSMLLKPYVTGKRNVVDIDEDIKRYFYQIYQKEGLKGLEDL